MGKLLIYVTFHDKMSRNTAATDIPVYVLRIKCRFIKEGYIMHKVMYPMDTSRNSVLH